MHIPSRNFNPLPCEMQTDAFSDKLASYFTESVRSLRRHCCHMNKLLSVYLYPTLTVLIDDSQSFLDSIAFQLNPKLACITFNDAQMAIDWLNNAHWQSASYESIRVGYDEQTESFARRSASIDLDLIYHHVMDRNRFATPTVLVIDFVMPQMNGIDFCMAIQSLPCKKILLTGQADEKIALDAFNCKLIDRFIKKNEPDALNRLESEISKLQREFFIEQTSTLKDLLSRHSHAFISDPAIAILTGELCIRYSFVEYYLFPNPAGILFFDCHGKPTLMVIETNASLSMHREIAQDQYAPPELLTALRELRLVPFFCDSGGMYRDTIRHDWLSYCLPPQICEGRESYYYALFDLPSHYLQSPVYSYAEFLRDQAPI